MKSIFDLRRGHSWVVPCSLLLVFISVGGWCGQVLPIEDFCRAPTLRHVRLAPDGAHMAALTAEQGTNYIVVSDLVAGRFTKLVVPPLSSFVWVTDRRLLCQSAGWRYGEVFAINIDGGDAKVLETSFFNQARNRELHQIHVLKVLRSSSDSVLVTDCWVTRWNIGKYRHPNVQRLNFFTGEMTMEEKNPGKVISWMADASGTVRGAVGVDKDTVQLLYRAGKGQPWSVVHTSTKEEFDLKPAGFGSDDQLFVYSHAGMDLLGLYRFNPQTKELGSCISSDPGFDLTMAVFNSGGKPLGAYYNGERVTFRALDESYAKWQATVDRSLPDRVNVPISSVLNGQKIVYLSFSDRDPGSYYLVDREKNEFGVVGRAETWVNPEEMAVMKPIQYSARDGVTIHGYLTVPKGVAATNLPLVVMPHGGPSYRDSWSYDPEVQFLANRGYGVLQVNFRGSLGYGLKFHRAGFKEWGGKMQDDITDGVNWAVSQGIADGKRVGIFGVSYGGYAAVMGLVKTPELFRCAICYAGVTDVRAITRRPGPSGEVRGDLERLAREEIGDYREDKLHLEEISPVNLAEKIQAPILLAYGGRDHIVDVEQGKALAAVLKKNNKRYELIIENGEGHGFVTERAQSNFLFRAERFLRENLCE